jgi:hypothetical protein
MTTLNTGEKNTGFCTGVQKNMQQLMQGDGHSGLHKIEDGIFGSVIIQVDCYQCAMELTAAIG